MRYNTNRTPVCIIRFGGVSKKRVVVVRTSALSETLLHQPTTQEGIATDKAFRGTEDVETNAFDVLDYDVRKVFDGFFTRLSDIEKYFVLVKVGCSDVRLSMTYQQIAVDELFVSIVEADKKFSRNISVGQIVVERPDRKSVKNCQKLVLEDVKHVNYTFIQYMKPKTEKKLQMLKDTLRMSDITGDCGIAYFMDRWERLLRKYRQKMGLSQWWQPLSISQK